MATGLCNPRDQTSYHRDHQSSSRPHTLGCPSTDTIIHPGIWRRCDNPSSLLPCAPLRSRTQIQREPLNLHQIGRIPDIPSKKDTPAFVQDEYLLYPVSLSIDRSSITPRPPLRIGIASDCAFVHLFEFTCLEFTSASTCFFANSLRAYSFHDLTNGNIFFTPLICFLYRVLHS